jgi:hypothetical protein
MRDEPLERGLDTVADTVSGWSEGQLADDASLMAIERTE